jgi:outer membrane receptor protein involved in Fe transport
MMKGSGSSAGGVNFVRKRGQDKAATTVTLSAGSWDNYRGQVDVGGPLNESGTVRGRAVAALQDVSTSMTRPSARTRYCTAPSTGTSAPTPPWALAWPTRTSMPPCYPACHAMPMAAT